MDNSDNNNCLISDINKLFINVNNCNNVSIDNNINIINEHINEHKKTCCQINQIYDKINANIDMRMKKQNLFDTKIKKLNKLTKINYFNIKNVNKCTKILKKYKKKRKNQTLKNFYKLIKTKIRHKISKILLYIKLKLLVLLVFFYIK